MFHNAIPFDSARNGILAVDASDDSDVVFGEVDTPPENFISESNQNQIKKFSYERLKPHLLPPKLLYAWMLEVFK